MPHRFATAVFCVLIAAPSVVVAQSASARDGFWMRVGGSNGWGSCAASSGPCLTSATAPAVTLAGGMVLGPHFLLGLNLEAWRGTATLNGNGANQALGFLLVDASWYPSASRGWFLRGGLGSTQMTITPRSGGRVNSMGAAVGVGTGYDVPIAAGLSVTPYVSYTAALSASADTTGGPRAQGKLFQVGAAISWY